MRGSPGQADGGRWALGSRSLPLEWGESEGRQINIEEQLNCRFIRVSDDKTHIKNSAIVIKEIFNIKEIV